MGDRYRPREYGIKRKREQSPYTANPKLAGGSYRPRGDLNGSSRLEDVSRNSCRSEGPVNPGSPTDWVSNRYGLYAGPTTDSYALLRSKGTSEKSNHVTIPCSKVNTHRASISDTTLMATATEEAQFLQNNGSFCNPVLEKRVIGIDQKAYGSRRPILNSGEDLIATVEHSHKDQKPSLDGELSSDGNLHGFLTAINPKRGRYCNRGTDESVREFSRRGKESPVESVSATEDESDKPDRVYSVSEESFRRHGDSIIDNAEVKSDAVNTDSVLPSEGAFNVGSGKNVSSNTSISVDIEHLPQKKIADIRDHFLLIQSLQSIQRSSKSCNGHEASNKLSESLVTLDTATDVIIPTAKELSSVHHSLPPKPFWTIETSDIRNVEAGANVSDDSESLVLDKFTSENFSSAESAMSISSGSPAPSVASTRKRSALASCIQCKESAVPPFRILIQCVNCNFNYHAHCHNPVVPTKNGKLINIDVETWICSRCSKNRELSQPSHHSKLSTPSVSSGCPPSAKKKKLELEVESCNAVRVGTPMGVNEDSGEGVDVYHISGTSKQTPPEGARRLRTLASDCQNEISGKAHETGKLTTSTGNSDQRSQTASKSTMFGNLFCNAESHSTRTLDGSTRVNNSSKSSQKICSTPTARPSVSVENERIKERSDALTAYQLESIGASQKDRNSRCFPTRFHLELPSEIQDSQPSQGHDGYLSDVSMDLDSPTEEIREAGHQALHTAITSQGDAELTMDTVISMRTADEGDSTKSITNSSPPYSPPYSPTLDATPITADFRTETPRTLAAAPFPVIIPPLQTSYPMSTQTAMHSPQPQIPTVLQQLLSTFSGGSVTLPCAMCTKAFTTLLSLARPDGLNYCLACQRSCLSVPNLVYPSPLLGSVGTGSKSSETPSNFQIKLPVVTSQQPQLSENQRNSPLGHSDRQATQPQTPRPRVLAAANKSIDAPISACTSDNRTEREMVNSSDQIMPQSFKGPKSTEKILYRRPKTAAEIVLERYQASQSVFIPGSSLSTRSEESRSKDQTSSYPEIVKERKKYSFQQYTQKRLSEVSESRPTPVSKKNAESPRKGKEAAKKKWAPSVHMDKPADPQLTLQNAINSTNVDYYSSSRENATDSRENCASSFSIEALNWKKKFEEQKGFVLNHVKHIQKLTNTVEKERKARLELEKKVAGLEALLATASRKRVEQPEQDPVNSLSHDTREQDTPPRQLAEPASVPRYGIEERPLKISIPSQKDYDYDRPILISSLYKDFTFEVTELKLKCLEETVQAPVTSLRTPYSAVRKHHYPLLAGTNPRSLHVHRQVDRESFYFASGIMSNEASRDVSVATDEEEDMCLAQYLQLPNNLVPSLKDGMLAFRSAQVSARSRRLERNSKIYKVGRDVPGELRGLR